VLQMHLTIFFLSIINISQNLTKLLQKYRGPVFIGTTWRSRNSHINMHTHASIAFDNHVTLTFHLLISGSMHAERLPKFGVDTSNHFFRAQLHPKRHKVKYANHHPTYTLAAAGMGNYTLHLFRIALE